MRKSRWAWAVAVALLLIAWAASFGEGPENPPVRSEPAWDSPKTRELAVRACYDCHSNETVWPWYSKIPPISWLIHRHVSEGREELNYSEWDRSQEEAGESAETVVEGEMPPWWYTVLQSKARLSATEREALIRGLQATFGGEREGGRESREGEDGPAADDDDD